jgi:hypothetical protein
MTNGSSGVYGMTGPRPAFSNVTASALVAMPMAVVNGTDSQRVQPA